MTLRRLEEDWEAFARGDPLWAILTVPGKRGRRWDEAEFFETGRREIDGVLAAAAARGLAPAARRCARDVGCGVGRLTQALCPHFARAVGVDIAPTMIAEARRRNAFGERCAYVQNAAPDLRVLGDERFDFAYTSIVLQHMAPELALGYLAELARLLAPGGLLVAQAPERMRQPYRTASRLLRLARGAARRLSGRRPPEMQMHGIDPGAVARAVAGAGAAVRATEPDPSLAPAWVSHRYWITKP